LRIVHLLVLLFPLLAGSPAQATVTLRNALWAIDVEPDSLAITVRPAQASAPGVPLVLSLGGPSHRVQALQGNAASAQWQWDEGAYHVTSRLDGPDLTLSILARKPGELTVLRQPAAAMGRALALPLAEGHYVPAGDPGWRRFLLSTMSRFDTTQDISLPLWTLDHGGFTLSWILLNRFNNTVGFTPDGEGLALGLTHAFSALDAGTPMTVMLHLGASDPLAGAKRYRAWLRAQGNFRSLSEKIRQTPQGEKLIGATHLYLWGHGMLGAKDIVDWPLFLRRLQGGGALTAQFRASIDRAEWARLRGMHDGGGPAQRRIALDAINATFDAMARAGWQTAAPDMRVLTRRYAELRDAASQAFAGAVAPDAARWGGGVSLDTMDALRNSGLRRLWIGIGQGWEGGLWHPEAIGAGVEVGYLVAPYDSYETALAPGGDPSWVSAHLGTDAYERCAVVRRDGGFQPGFQGAGRYTDPACVRPLLQARIRAILAAVPFNSWFLDVYATGMVFDDHRPGHARPQARYAAESARSLRWIGQLLGLPAGSEDGNSGADDLLFAHGMQTPVIGWGDPDMQRNRASRYFTGAWYPQDAPAKFFKRVPLKAHYRRIHFDPATRLPLYQAVYHGAVITTHHWLFDSLKLPDVHTQNTLLQLLYNVPPLFHISSATLAQRLPYIVCRDAFFRPLHQRLATQTLLEFAWLTQDRLVQATRFQDGTVLVANFRPGPHAYRGQLIPGETLAAFLPGEGRPAMHPVGKASGQPACKPIS
jgi:hypothetical protein